MDDNAMEDVRVAWSRLVAALVEHQHPGAALLLPAERDPLPADLVAGSGGDWPDELTLWFGVHDGVGGDPRADFLEGCMPLGAADAEQHWLSNLDAAGCWSG